MKILIACEYSGRTRNAFAALGHDVISADFEPAEDGSPYHYQGDCFDLIADQALHAGKREAAPLRVSPPPSLPSGEAKAFRMGVDAAQMKHNAISTANPARPYPSRADKSSPLIAA